MIDIIFNIHVIGLFWEVVTQANDDFMENLVVYDAMSSVVYDIQHAILTYTHTPQNK